MKNLISMTDFVLTDKYTATGHMNYAKFLKQPLSIEMFVPCKLVDGVWVVLEEPNPEDYFPVNKQIDKFTDEDKKGLDSYYSPMMEYQEAKERCLFDGFRYFSTKSKREHYVFMEGYEINLKCFSKMTIESISKENILLTSTAQKQIGL